MTVLAGHDEGPILLLFSLGLLSLLSWAIAVVALLVVPVFRKVRGLAPRGIWRRRYPIYIIPSLLLTMATILVVNSPGECSPPNLALLPFVVKPELEPLITPNGYVSSGARINESGRLLAYTRRQHEERVWSDTFVVFDLSLGSISVEALAPAPLSLHEWRWAGPEQIFVRTAYWSGKMGDLGEDRGIYSLSGPSWSFEETERKELPEYLPTRADYRNLWPRGSRSFDQKYVAAGAAFGNCEHGQVPNVRLMDATGKTIAHFTELDLVGWSAPDGSLLVAENANVFRISGEYLDALPRESS